MRRDVHYYGLDLLRLGAAGLVLSDHFGLFGRLSPTAHARGSELAFPALAGMTDLGSVGVEIFFLISGFVIAASAQGVSARRFLLNRAIRVFPALWICGLVALAARWMALEPPGFLVAAFLRSATLWPAGEHIDGVVWSLVVEAVFYALVALVLVFDLFDRIEDVAKGLGLVSAAFVVVMASVQGIAAFEPRLASLAGLLDRFPTKVFLLRHGVFFALGILLWVGFRTGFSRRRLAWIAAMSAVCTVELVINRGPGSALAAILVWWIGFAWIVVSVGRSERIQDLLQARARFWRDMGRLSYPLYLNHYVLGMEIVPVLFALGLGPIATFSTTLATVVATSYLVMRGPERWVQHLLRDWLTPPIRREAVASPELPPASLSFR